MSDEQPQEQTEDLRIPIIHSGTFGLGCKGCEIELAVVALHHKRATLVEEEKPNV